jgi:hypothetical protein
MSFGDVVGVINDSLTLVAVLVGMFLAVFVYYQFAPILTLRILPRWVNDNHTLLCVRVEIENKSRVRVSSPQGKLQVLEHPIDPKCPLNHWVAFDREGIWRDDPILEWREPVHFFDTTRNIYPGEIYAVERIYPCSHEQVAVHIGLQVYREKRWIDKLLNRSGETWRQTSTCFMIKA